MTCWKKNPSFFFFTILDCNDFLVLLFMVTPSASNNYNFRKGTFQALVRFFKITIGCKVIASYYLSTWHMPAVNAVLNCNFSFPVVLILTVFTPFKLKLADDSI